MWLFSFVLVQGHRRREATLANDSAIYKNSAPPPSPFPPSLPTPKMAHAVEEIRHCPGDDDDDDDDDDEETADGLAP